MCVLFKVVDHGSRCWCNTAQALAQWQHPVAPSEALDVLYRAMRPLLYRCVRMAIEIASNLPAFLVLLIHCCPLTWLNNTVAININLIRDAELFINMLVVYWYCLGTRRRHWMPFRPPFLTVGERLVKNKMSCRIKLISLLFYRFI